ncbi:MAG: hypothetical protein J7L61_00525 [Thermoplasmata archaeon]|nr:hypothetical protein [Thermoplasmata archaeon]
MTGEHYVRVSVRVPHHLVEKARDVIEEDPEMRNLSDYVRRAMEEYYVSYAGERMAAGGIMGSSVGVENQGEYVYLKIRLPAPVYWRVKWLADHRYYKTPWEAVEMFLFENLRDMTVEDAKEAMNRDARFLAFMEREESSRQMIRK